MSSKKPLIAVLALALLLGAGLFLYNQQSAQQAALQPDTPLQAEDETAPAATETATLDQSSTSVDPSAPSADVTQIDIPQALSDRALGNPDAPVVIQEFSSLTCGHCGEFHKNAFDQIKAEYIDTGKVYLIFRDFPLNAPAVTATMVARCLPAERYYSFIDLLFKNQEKWAYDANYINYLRQNAALAGLGQDAFESCVANNDLRQAITSKARESSLKYQINSTPSFVINESNVQTGARDFNFYKQIIEAELAKVATPTPSAPATSGTEAAPADTQAPVSE